jgi:hypothetical protein
LKSQACLQLLEMFRHLKNNCSILIKERLYSTNVHLKYDHGYKYRNNKRKANEYKQIIQVLNTREHQLSVKESSNKSSALTTKAEDNLEQYNIKKLSNEILHKNNKENNENDEYNENNDDLNLLQNLNKMVKKLQEKDEINRNNVNIVTENFNKEIITYIDACVNNTNSKSLINEALDTIRLLSTPNQRLENKKLTDVEIFNKIYFYLASMKKLNDIGYFFKLMRSNNIQPNIHSYAACLLSVDLNYYKSKVIVARILNDISNAVSSKEFVYLFIFECFCIILK